MSKRRSHAASVNSADPRRDVWREGDTSCENRRTGYGAGMCRNIRPLFNFEPPATDEEVVSAALQYVRKISGTRKPSASNLKAFDRAVANIAKATRALVDSLETKEAPKNRETEAAKARQKNALRFA